MEIIGIVPKFGIQIDIKIYDIKEYLFKQNTLRFYDLYTISILLFLNAERYNTM